MGGGKVLCLGDMLLPPASVSRFINAQSQQVAANRRPASQGAVKTRSPGQPRPCTYRERQEASFVGMRLLSNSLSTINHRTLRTACSILQARCDACRVLIPLSLLPRVSMPHTVQVSRSPGASNIQRDACMRCDELAVLSATSCSSVFPRPRPRADPRAVILSHFVSSVRFA